MVASRQTFDFADLKDRVSGRGLQLAEHLFGSPGKRAGRALQYSNPHIEQRTPSFTVYADGGFSDFATGEHGSAIDLIMLATGGDLPAAVRYLEEFVGGSAPTDHRQYSQPAPKAETHTPGQRWQTAAADAVETANAYLFSSAPDAQAALAYLHDVRGLTDATIRSARLGYSPRWTATACTKPDGKPAHLAPGIIIPWYASGVLVAVRTRRRIGNLADALHIAPDTDREGDKPSKYTSLSGSTFGSAPYNADRLTDATDVLIVEGEFDALLAQQHADQDGIAIAVITAGSASGTIAPAVFSSALRVILATDNDAPGQAARTKLLAALANANVYTAAMPSGKDITDYLTLHNGQLADVLATAQRAELPDTFRAALNTYAPPPLTPTVELYIEACRAGLIDSSIGVSAAELVEFGKTLGREVSETTIRRGLAEGERGGLFAVLPTYIPTGKEVSLSIGKTANNLGGRPVKRFQLCGMSVIRVAILEYAAPRIIERFFPVSGRQTANVRADLLIALDVPDAETMAAQLAARYAATIGTDAQRDAMDKARQAYKALRSGLDRMHSTPLPANWQYENAAAYVSVYTRARLAARDGLQVAKAVLAAELGVSARNIATVIARAGVRADQQYVDQPVENAAMFSSAIERPFSQQHKGRAKRLVVGAKEYTFEDSTGRDAARAAFARGEIVTIKYQQANRYTIATAVQPHKPEKAEKRERIPTRPRAPLMDRRPPRQHFYGKGHDPAWAEAQLVNLLGSVTVWHRQADRLFNRATGEYMDFSVSATLALLLDKPIEESADSSAHDETETPISMDAAAQLCDQASEAERAGRLAGQPRGEGKAKYLATLTSEQLAAMARYEKDEEIW